MPEPAAASDQILRTKVQMPRLRPKCVARPGLIARLNDAEWQKLTLICAPAGFGKTTLLTLWSCASSSAFTWLTLDDGDNSLERFLRYLIIALQNAVPGAGKTALVILNSPQAIQTEQILASLINDFAEINARTILVIDDFHVIHTPAINDAVQYLLDHLPESLHLVIASRTDPSLMLSRLRARGELTELRGGDLRFSVEETAEFFKQVMSLALSNEEIEALAQRTEGWVAGMQLVALSIQNRPDPNRLIRVITGSNRYILDYLMEEVLRQQSPPIHEFLLKTSILERLTDGLCSAITGRDDSQATLETLEQTNLFIQALDDQRCWYRYHTLFLDLLRYQLEQTYPGESAGIHLRAAAWFETQGLHREAVNHWLGGGDEVRAGQLVGDAGGELLGRGSGQQMIGWFETLPPSIFKKCPRLHLLYAFGLISLNQFHAVEARLKLLEKDLNDSVDIDDETQKSIEAEVFATRAIVGFTGGDMPLAIEKAKEALAILPDDHMLTSSICIGLGIAYRMNGELTQAADALKKAVDISIRLGHTAVRPPALCSLADLYLWEGALQTAERTYRQVLEIIDQDPNSIKSFAAQAYLGLANIYYEQNKLDSARDTVQAAVDLVKTWGNIDIIVSSAICQAVVYYAFAQYDLSAAALQRASDSSAKSIGNPVIQSAFATAQLRMWLRSGDLGSARNWLQDHPMPPYAPYVSIFQPECLARVEVMIYDGHTHANPARLPEARALLLQIEPLLDKSGFTCLKYDCWMLLAMERYASGDHDRAYEFTRQTIEAAQSEGFIRLFLDKGPLGAALLFGLKHNPQSRQLTPAGQAHLGRLLAGFGERPRIVPSDGQKNDLHPARSHQDLPEPLSERELEVFRLVALGLNNQEIAERLVLAQGTVKRHIHNIFSKLDVSTRAQAIARGRELRLA